MAGRQQLTQADYEALAEFRYALRQFLHFSEDAARAAGLTPQQHQAMLAIKGFPGRDRITITRSGLRLGSGPGQAGEAGQGLAANLAGGKIVR